MTERFNQSDAQVEKLVAQLNDRSAQEEASKKMEAARTEQQAKIADLEASIQELTEDLNQSKNVMALKEKELSDYKLENEANINQLLE